MVTGIHAICYRAANGIYRPDKTATTSAGSVDSQVSIYDSHERVRADTRVGECTEFPNFGYELLLYLPRSA